MRHGTSNRRSRNRGNNGGRRSNQNRNQVFDSNGPDVRIRGTAHQVAERYLALAKDASSAGDHTVAENYFQHAEHYIRIINEISGAQEANKVKGLKTTMAAEDEENRSDKADKKDDLSLPSTILGPEVPVEAKKEEREIEAAD